MKKPAEPEGEGVLCFFVSQMPSMSDAQNENDSLRLGCGGMRRGGKRGERNEKKRSRDGEAERNEE